MIFSDMCVHTFLGYNYEYYARSLNFTNIAVHEQKTFSVQLL